LRIAFGAVHALDTEVHGIAHRQEKAGTRRPRLSSWLCARIKPFQHPRQLTISDQRSLIQTIRRSRT